MTPAATELHPAKGASILACLAGLWLFLSPWIYGAYGNPHAWNSWIAGGLIFLCGVIRANRPAATTFSWANSILAIWIFISPWVLGYAANTGWLINSLFVGLILFCAAVIGANSERMSHDPMSTA